MHALRPRSYLLETTRAAGHSTNGATSAPAPVPAYRPFIRTATSGDVAAMAALQVTDLPIGLFPRLGPRFVERWHHTFLDSPHAVALVAVRRAQDGTESVVGFLIGSTDRQALRAELLARHRTALMTRGIIALAARPRVLACFLRTRLRPYLCRLARRPAVRAGAERARPDTHGPAGQVCGPVADLTAIAVRQAARRDGTGRRLADIYLARCAAAGVDWVELVTSQGSMEAREFYSSTGWTAMSQDDTRDGVRVQRFGRRPGPAEGA